MDQEGLHERWPEPVASLSARAQAFLHALPMYNSDLGLAPGEWAVLLQNFWHLARP